MNRFFLALVGAVLAIASMQVSAKAATIVLGDVTDATSDAYGGAVSFFFVPQAIADDVSFHLSAPAYVTGNLQNLLLQGTFPIIGTVTFADIPDLAATFLGNPLSLDSNGNFSLGGLLAAGDYLIHVTGTTAGLFGGAYYVAVAAATTPIPGALLLFLTAMGGMAGFARFRRGGAAEA